jgi:SagB-type dehydrogenase family enzyme
MRISAVIRYPLATALSGAAILSVARGVADEKTSALPSPVLAGHMSLEEALARRRSIRQFTDEPLSLKEIAQLCWAGQGITDETLGFRASPSAGALYPIELYVVTTRDVAHYRPKDHTLQDHADGDHRQALQKAALDQAVIGRAPACFVITAVIERTARKYGQRARRYCLLEAGHVAQNILLQATVMDLGGTPVGAFNDDQVNAALKLPKNHRVLYLLPIGHPPG